jgi:hypothetical protein
VPAKHLERVLELGHPLRSGVIGGAEGLVLAPAALVAAPDANGQPARPDRRDRGPHLGQDRRVAQRGTGDERADPDPLGRRGEPRERRPALEDRPALVAPQGPQVVEDPYGVEARRLRPARRRHERARVAAELGKRHPQPHLAHVALAMR